VNGDGFDDVIVGAYTNDLVGGNNGGKAYLYLGGSHMDNVVDVTFNGSAAFDYFGVCVAGVGDVNNDGYDDVLISARGVNVRGRTSIYFGGPVMNNVPDVTLNGEVDYNYFGESAAGAGDINGDGYADVIIGAFGNNSYTGKVYIYYGGASMDTIPDLTFTGEAASDRFGGSVSGAGDVNGDGFNDAIVGAWYAGATTEGKAYLYLSSAGPLPIQLAGFSGTSIGNDQVRLNWTTLSEVNNYGFEVQRRQTGGPEFQTLPNSFTPGHGTTIEPHSYSFTDPTASAGQWAYRLKQIDLDGSLHYSELVNVRVLTSVEGDAVPARFTLEQNYPNPFNPSTTIRYELPHASQVSLKVYNTLGQEVATLVNETKAAGVYTAEFDAAGLASGVYFYRMQAGTFVEVKKLVVLR
jgi:hypothetical protein